MSKLQEYLKPKQETQEEEIVAEPRKNKLFDFLKSDRREGEPQAAADIRTESNERAMIAGATPLLVGLLTGNTGDALEISSKALLQEDQRAMKEQKGLMDYLKKQESESKKNIDVGTGKRRYQAQSYEDESGNIRVGVFDTFTGKMDKGDTLKGYRKSSRVDPRTGELVTTSGALGSAAPTQIEGSTQTPYTVKEERDVSDMEKRFLADKEVTRARQGMGASNRAMELLKLNNPISDEGIKTVFPRMFGEVGNLAVQEQERFSGSPELMRRWERLRDKYSRGKLSDADRSDLLQVAQVMFEYDRQKAQRLASDFAEITSRRTGIAKDKLIGSLSPLIQRELKAGRVAKKVKKDFAKRLTGDEKRLYDWAIKNKSDPKSAKVIDKLRRIYGN